MADEGLRGRPAGGRVEPGGEAWKATVYEPGDEDGDPDPATVPPDAADLTELPCPICARRGLKRTMDDTSTRSRECRCGTILLLPAG